MAGFVDKALDPLVLFECVTMLLSFERIAGILNAKALSDKLRNLPIEPSMFLPKSLPFPLLAYRTAPADSGQRQLVWLDRSGRETDKVVYPNGAGLGGSLSHDAMSTVTVGSAF